MIAASDSTTPLSGVRVKTAQTTAIAPDKVAEGNEYTLTVTGRQSGKSVTVDFQAPAAGSSDKSADKNADKNGVIASGKVNNNPKVDGSPLGETGTAVAVVAIARGHVGRYCDDHQDREDHPLIRVVHPFPKLPTLSVL